jgi:hypothetical protein
VLWLLGIALVGAAVGPVIVFRLGQRGPRGPIHPIAQASEAEVVRIRGRVACDRPLTAPLTGRPCVYYRIEYRCTPGGKSATRAGAQQVDFTVRDDSGVAQILVERAAFEIVADIFETGRASAISPPSAAALAERGWEVPDIARIEVCEAIVAVDATIDVIGQPTRVPEPDVPRIELGYRDALPARLVFAAGHRVVEKPRERRYIGAR